jgi:hypothetical protein
VLSLGGVVSYTVAVATTTGHHSLLLFWVFGLLAATGIGAYFAGQNARTVLPTPAHTAVAGEEPDSAELPWGETYALTSEAPPAEESAEVPRTSPPVTAAWRHTSDGFEASPLMMLTSLAMPGFFGRAESPNVRVGVAIACDSLSPDADSSEMGKRFTEFLKAETVRKLLSAIAIAPDGRHQSWTRHAGRGIDSLQAVLGLNPDEPLASAMLHVPVAGRNLYGRDSRLAALWLHLSPPEQNGNPERIGLGAWFRFFVDSLDLADHLVKLLTEGFGLRCWDDPAARVGVMLESAGSTLAALVDAHDRVVMPGATPSSQFLGYAIADRAGGPVDDIARALIRQLCDYTLQIDVSSRYLSMIGTAPDPGTLVSVPLTDGHRREGTVIRFDADHADPRLVVRVQLGDDAPPIDLAYGADVVQPIPSSDPPFPDLGPENWIAR